MYNIKLDQVYPKNWIKLSLENQFYYIDSIKSIGGNKVNLIELIRLRISDQIGEIELNILSLSD